MNKMELMIGVAGALLVGALAYSMLMFLTGNSDNRQPKPEPSTCIQLNAPTPQIMEEPLYMEIIEQEGSNSA